MFLFHIFLCPALSIFRTKNDYITLKFGLQKQFSVFPYLGGIDGQALITAVKTYPPARARMSDFEMKFREPGIKIVKHVYVGFKGHPAVVSQPEHADTVMDHQIETGCGKKPGILCLIQLRIEFGNIQPFGKPVMGQDQIQRNHGPVVRIVQKIFHTRVFSEITQ
jgi:hypothetical protein